MDNLPEQAAAPPSRRMARTSELAGVLLLALVALLPRTLNLGLFLDSDEINFWVPRAHQFLQHMQRGNPAETAISTHPGVTTMWLGSGAILLRRALLEWGIIDSVPFPLFLALMRLPVALVQSAGVLLGYALLRQVLPVGVALLAAFFWAADPFAIAYARILHVDGLTTTFATLSLLAVCVALFSGDLEQPRPGYLLLSGVCGALAVLSKSPGLAVLPIVGLLLLFKRPFSLRPQPFSFLHSAFSIILWGGAFALTLLLVYPAVWADPVRVYDLYRIGVQVEGGSPHVIGNFFLGRENDTPGPLYYPVVLALRLTPITLVGLLLLPLVWWRLDERTRRVLAVLVAFVLLFVLAMSFFPKKLNRYAVPVFPALDVLAAVGFAALMHHAALSAQRFSRIAQRFPCSMLHALCCLLILLAVLNAAHWHPYHVVAFNQVLGGTPTAARTLLLGDGEGLAEAARWLNQQPDITGVRVASTMINSLQPYLRHGAQSVSPDEDGLDPRDGYVLIYIRHTQRGVPRPPFDQFYPHQQPVYTVMLHGVAFVRVYQVPPPIAHPLEGVTFTPSATTAAPAASVHLVGYEVAPDTLQTTGYLTLTVQWRTTAPLASDYLLFAHVLNDDGQRVGQIDVPPGGPESPTSTWQPGRVFTWQHPLPLPPDLPAGDYWLALGLYDPADFARLPLTQPAQVPPADPPAAVVQQAGDAALLLPIRIPGTPE